MKLLLILSLLFFSNQIFSQSLDYISVRKKNGRVVKNFYSGSDIVLQTIENRYLQGPIKAIRNDSVFVTIYDIRYVPTIYGTYKKDTVSIMVAGLHKSEIKTVMLSQRKSFFQRMVPSLLMIGGAGYLTLNLLNGTFFSSSVTGEEKLKKLGFSAGAFGLGYLLHKMFSNDGFSTKKHQIVYVDL